MKDTLAFQITALYRDFLSYTRKELKESGLSFGLMPLILYTGRNPGCTQSALTGALKMDWGYSQRSIAKLEEQGFITKYRDGDSQYNRLKLTAKGSDVFDLCHKVFERWDRARMNDLSSGERALIISLLGRVAAEER